jgi:hypothetical protein
MTSLFLKFRKVLQLEKERVRNEYGVICGDLKQPSLKCEIRLLINLKSVNVVNIIDYRL